MQDQKTKSATEGKNNSAVFTCVTTVYHCCQRCFKDLIFCNNEVTLLNELSWFCRGCRMCHRCVKCQSLFHKCAKLRKYICNPCLNFLVEKNCVDLHYINSKFIVT